MVPIDGIHAEWRLEAAQVFFDMGIFGKAGFVIEQVANEDDHVGMLRIAQFHQVLRLALPDDLPEMGIRDHHDAQTIAGTAPARQVDVDMLHNRIRYIVVRFHEEEHVCYNKQEEKHELRFFPIPSDDARQPFPSLLTPVNHFEHEQAQRNVKATDIPRVADVHNRDEPRVGQILMKQIAEEEERQL